MNTNLVRLLSLYIALNLALFSGLTQAESITFDKAQSSFIKKHTDGTLSADEISMVLVSAQKNQSVLDAIAKPWEAKPWYQYYPLFLTNKRLQAGLKFWTEHKATINRAAKIYQVDAEMIVAIIGIETFYGEYKGKYKVLDSLYTLGFYYPSRGQFFRKELANFLKLAKEEQLDIKELKGSYAGAMGYGQFIPSSYRHYAVDFDADGKRDLINNPVDAIGSVANYFHRHGWKKGNQVAIPLINQDHILNAKPWSGEKPYLKISNILNPKLSLKHSQDIDIKKPGILIELEQATKKEYWLGLNNFYVITRYNHSPLYAMAAYQFSQQLKKAYTNETN